MDPPDRKRVRLAELVAALSLGVDLGFGQPMEHVLRQCLIALRLGERIGLDEQARAVVYYTALLGQRRMSLRRARAGEVVWRRHRPEVGQVRPRAREPAGGGSGDAAARLGQPAPPPLPRRARVRDLRTPRGGWHDRPARRHRADARRAARAARRGARSALGGAYEQWDGRGWPGELEGEAVPVAARLAQLAEFTEVAYRVGGIEAARALAGRRAGKQFDPALAELICTDGDTILADLDSVPTWDAVIEAEPALAVMLSADSFEAALVAIANFVDLKSPYTLGHARAVVRARGRGRRGARAGRRSWCSWCDARAWCTISAALGSRTPSGTSPGRWARASGSACECTRI